MDVPPSAGPTRADAARNRRRVLDAASMVFATHGPKATLNDVAREAGVGVGTVYRKFPDKDAVLDALFADKIAVLVGLAQEAAAVHDPGVALRGLMLGVMTARAVDRGLDAVLMSPARGARFARELGETFMPIAQGLVARAAAAGQVRRDFVADEICLLGFMVGKVADVTRDSAPDVWRRYAQLLIDGTRSSASAERLAPDALSFDAMTAALGSAT